ncbi:MAG: DUF177 domain-containing protein [Reyranellaceae bacterium]
MTGTLQFVVPLKELTGEPVGFDLKATAPEREELRRRFGLVGLEELAADGTIYPLRGGQGLRLEGRLRAAVTQNCVVTLEPVVQRIDEAFAVEFGAAGEVIEAASGEMVLPPDQEQPEPLPENGLDLGALVAEQLALAIDPYPRREGADLEEVLRRHGIDALAGKPNPFAALAALKSKG